MAVRKNLSITHGKSYSKIYKVWAAMISRCKYKNYHAYHRYGGRGIEVCKRWLEFENFYKDMGDAPIGYELDRIDNNGDYEPNNCKWSTKAENAQNRISTNLTIDEVSFIKTMLKYSNKTQKVIANELGIHKQAIVDIKRGRSWRSVGPLPV